MKESQKMRKIVLMGMMMAAGAAFAANVTDTDDTLAFSAGKGVRVTEADTLDDKTFGSLKTVATFTTPLAEKPSLTLVDGNGDELPPTGLWQLMLADGNRTLKFGALRGTQILIR